MFTPEHASRSRRPRATNLVLAGFFVFTLAFAAVHAQDSPHFGRPISESDVAAWDISILPDGTGLPPGSGTSAQGAQVFATKCAVCHGENGKGGTAAALVGGEPLTAGIETTKTIANFWPYATTIFDFTRRAMT
jgi:cytochrome c